MVLAKIEGVLNRYIGASAAAQRRCQQLQGKTLCLKLDGIPTPFALTAQDGKLTLAAGAAAPVDATLAGSPLKLLALARNRTGGSFSDGGVQITGDAEVAQGFAELLKSCKPDLEEELAQWVGDVAAYRLSSAARAALAFGERAVSTFTTNVGEYLQEESRDVPHRAEVDDFVRGVDTLRDDVERFAARLRQLEQHKL